MSRKTINVEFVLARANAYLASDDSTADGRESICGIIDSVLMEAGQYSGFRYLDVENHEAEGIGSKREYFKSRNLT